MTVAVLGHLAAHEGAAGLAAALGHARHHRFDGGRHEPAHAHVVEEEERVGALDGDVVHAHGHQVDADGVEAAGRFGHLQLRAHAVGRRHQHRVVVPAGHGHQAAEATDVAEDLGAVGGSHVAGDPVHRLVGGVEVDAGGPVPIAHRSSTDFVSVRGTGTG